MHCSSEYHLNHIQNAKMEMNTNCLGVHIFCPTVSVFSLESSFDKFSMNCQYIIHAIKYIFTQSMTKI